MPTENDDMNLHVKLPEHLWQRLLAANDGDAAAAGRWAGITIATVLDLASRVGGPAPAVRTVGEAEVERDTARRQRDAYRRELIELQAENARLKAALTPSAETKAAYIGEFGFYLEERDERGREHARRVTVPWTTIKEIMAAIRARALVEAPR